MGFEGTIQEMADQLIEDFEGERCTIRGLRRNKLKLIVARGVNAEKRRDEIEIIGTIAGDALSTGKIQNIPDITKDERYDPSYVVHNGAKALMAMPLLFEGEFLCVAQIYREKFFSVSDEKKAKTLARHMASTLRHIEISKLNRQATLDIFMAILSCETFQDAFMYIVKEVSEHLDIPRCLIYRIQKREKEPWCQIVAGVPKGEHEIGLSDPLSMHPDIEATAEGKQILEISEPLRDERAKHLKSIIERKHINSILEVPIISEKKAIGVIVLDATQEKDGFSAEEKSFCYDISRIVGCLFDHERKQVEELEDRIFNPSASLAGLASRYLESVANVYEKAINVCQHNQKNCKGAEVMFKSALELMLNSSRIETDGKKLGAFVRSSREIKLG